MIAAKKKSKGLRPKYVVFNGTTYTGGTVTNNRTWDICFGMCTTGITKVVVWLTEYLLVCYAYQQDI